jgi:hypothetical protein
MNKPEAHPVELAIVAALLVMEALMTLVVAAVALVLTLANWRQPAPPAATAHSCAVAAPEAPLVSPTPHPLAAVADRLALLPVTALRAMTGIRSKRIRKADLIARLVACS